MSFFSSSNTLIIISSKHNSSYQSTRLISINAITLLFSNYPMIVIMWWAQFTNLLFEYDLLWLLGEPTLMVNPNHKLWLRYNHPILQVIQVFDSIIPLISLYSTTIEIRSQVINHFNQSLSHLHAEYFIHPNENNLREKY